MDNTFATPVNCRPLSWGADIVTHSTTKYMDGHAAALGGCIVDGGKFDWTKYPEKFPGLCTPDESYHGVTYTERFGLGGAFITKATAQLMRDLGAVQSPHNAFLTNLGLESLPVRVRQHCANAQRIAEHLQGHEKIAWVKYCGLPGDRYYELAQKYLPNGSCGVISFGVKGGRAARRAVYEPSEARLHRDARRRCADMLSASRQHDAPPDERQRACRSGCFSRPCAAVLRP